MNLRQLLGVVFFMAMLYGAYHVLQNFSQSGHKESASSVAPESEESTSSASFNSPQPAHQNGPTQNKVFKQPIKSFNSASAKMVSRNLHGPLEGVSPVVKRKVSETELVRLEALPAESHWKLVSTLVAVPVANVTKAERASAEGELSGFVIFDAPEGQIRERDLSSSGPLVVYNSRNKSYGILTGNLELTLHNSQDIQLVTRDYRLAVRDSFSEIKLFFVVPQAGSSNLQQVKSNLERDSRVADVELEIVSHQYAKN